MKDDIQEKTGELLDALEEQMDAMAEVHEALVEWQNSISKLLEIL